jgi:NAD(P)-dependent dehydrogenase (short-subunit alcohol dehydrogenase family)
MKILAITGGGQGIGRGIALRFAQSGYAVSILDADEKGGREAREKIEALGGAALFIRGDVSRERDVDDWLGQTAAKLGCPDVLVNNAGIDRNGPFLKLSAADFDRVIGVNLRGTFLCSQIAARLMIKQKSRGAIINIASTRAFMSEANTEAYSASKGGIMQLTKSLAVAWASEGIRVNAIAPGWIATEMTRGLVSDTTRSAHILERTPQKRWGDPADIAGVVVFLCSDAARFITGAILPIDGGYAAT